MSLNPTICETCLELRACNKAQVPMAGNYEARVVMVLPYPAREDEDGKHYEGGDAQTILSTVPPEYLNDFAITYLVKCPTYKNTVNRKEYAEPNKKVVNLCKKHLYDDLKQFTNNPIVLTFGGFVLKTITGDEDLKITKEYGTAREVKFKDLKLTVIPNLDPGVVRRKPGEIDNMKLYTRKAFEHTAAMAVPVDDKYEVLTPKRGIEMMDQIIADYKAGKISHVVFDIENSISLEPMHGGDVIMTSFTHDLMEKAYALPFYVTNVVHHKDWPYPVPKIGWEVSEVERLKLKAKTKELLETVPISGQNLKYDIKWCVCRCNVDLSLVRIWMDTLNVSVQLQNVGSQQDNSLKGLARKFFHVAEDWEREIDEYRERFKSTADRHYGNIPTGVLARYAALDAWYTKLIEHKFIEICPQGLLDAAAMVTDACVPLIEAEIKGVQMSKSMMAYLDGQYTNRLVELRNKAEELPIFRACMGKYLGPLEEINSKKKKPKPYDELKRDAFNFNYAAKVGEVVYGKEYYGLPGNPDFANKTSFSTDKNARAWLMAEVLADYKMAEIMADPDLAPLHDKWQEGKKFLQCYGSTKRIGKLRDDYIRTFPNFMDENFSYKPSFNPNGTVTGRLSSPFHSMPNGCDIKRVVVSRYASAGGLVLAADQSQLELRIVAALSQEQSLIDGFMAGVDAHTGTACAIYGIPPAQVTKKQRAVGKTVNFAILYGKTVYNLAADLNITTGEAQALMNLFYSRVHNLTLWKKKVEDETLRTGTVETMFGRVIHVPVAFSDRPKDIEEAKRFAVNYRVQSAASDIVLNSVTDIYRESKLQKLRSVFFATIHDSIEYDVYPGEVFAMVNTFKRFGEYEVQQKYPWITCPLHLDVELGTSWGGALKCSISEHDDKRMVFTTTGSRKDLFSLIHDARKAYNVDYTVTKEEKAEENAEDVFFVGGPELTAELCIEAK